MLSLKICLLEHQNKRYKCPACGSELEYFVPKRGTDARTGEMKTMGFYHRCPKHGIGYTVSPSTGRAHGDIADAYGLRGAPAPEAGESLDRESRQADMVADQFGTAVALIRRNPAVAERMSVTRLQQLARELEKHRRQGDPYPEVEDTVLDALMRAHLG